MVPECCVCHASLDVVCDVSEYGVWYVRLCEPVYQCVYVYCFNATAMVRVGAMGWLKPVATVLLMLCSAVFVECLVLNTCCVVWYVLCYVGKNHLLECHCNNR